MEGNQTNLKKKKKKKKKNLASQKIIFPATRPGLLTVPYIFKKLDVNTLVLSYARLPLYNTLRSTLDEICEAPLNEAA